MAPTTHSEAWGWSMALDLYACDPETIRSAEKIKEFVGKLITILDMKAFGNTQIVFFGEDEKVQGYSMTQLIETSLISGHFANASNAVYLDIFSCKPYDADEAAKFSRDFFGAEEFNLQCLIRK